MVSGTFQKIHTFQKYLIAVSVVVLTVLCYVLWSVNNEHAGKSRISAATCTISATLVNSCRPWIGATAGGYSMAPSDQYSQLLFYNKRLNNPNVLTNPGLSVTGTKKMDVAHVYHSQGSNLFSSNAQKVLNDSTFPYVMVNYKPLPGGTKWKDADGSNATVNNYIRTAANNVKALGSKKIFLAIWHEPENDVSVNNCAGAASGASMGSPADYVAMWRNTRAIFDQQGVSNVVWVMNYMGFKKWDCLVPQLWPGNSYVDWITWDPYAAGDETFVDSIKPFYDFLNASSDTQHAYSSKPYGLNEHGYGNQGGTNANSTNPKAAAYWDQGAAAITNKTLPNVKMYLVFDTSTNGFTRVGYGFDGGIDVNEQTAYDRFADASFALQSNSPPPPPPPPADTTPPTVSITAPSNGASVSGVVGVTASASDNVGVTRVQLYIDSTTIKDDTNGSDGWSSQWDTTQTSNGTHTLKATAFDSSGNSRSATISVNISNSSGSTPAPPAPTPVPDPSPLPPPAPIITAPTGQAVANVEAGGTVTQGTPLTLQPATVTDAEKVKSINKVEFYNNDLLLQTVTQAPFVFSTKDIKPGTYKLLQKTYYTDGTVTEASQTVTIKGKSIFATNKVRFAVGGGAGVALLASGFVGLRYYLQYRLQRRLAVRATHAFEAGVLDLPSGSVRPSQVIQPQNHQLFKQK